jgi:glycerophosphoryl diester phosphodiesterase
MTLDKPYARPKVIAHRGAAGLHPENTMAAFAAALETGADGLECDVQVSADGRPVVIHDSTVDRTTNGSGAVSGLTLEELRRLDAGGGEKIPTMAELLEMCRGRTLLTIEFKTLEGISPTLRLLGPGADDWIVLCSFLPEAVAACAGRRPDIPALLIVGSRSVNPVVRWREAFPLKTLRKVGARGVSWHHSLGSARKTSRLREAGYGVVLWSTPWEERKDLGWFGKAVGCDPDALVTIWPERLLEYLKEC